MLCRLAWGATTLLLLYWMHWYWTLLRKHLGLTPAFYSLAAQLRGLQACERLAALFLPPLLVARLLAEGWSDGRARLRAVLLGAVAALSGAGVLLPLPYGSAMALRLGTVALAALALFSPLGPDSMVRMTADLAPRPGRVRRAWSARGWWVAYVVGHVSLGLWAVSYAISLAAAAYGVQTGGDLVCPASEADPYTRAWICLGAERQALLDLSVPLALVVLADGWRSRRARLRGGIASVALLACLVNTLVRAAAGVRGPEPNDWMMWATGLVGVAAIAVGLSLPPARAEEATT